MKKSFSYASGQNKQKNISLFSNKDVATDKIQNSFVFNSSSIAVKNLPPAIKQWVNSIYSFNKSYTKTLPAVDVIVNKIIRSFFSINPLANNPGGKKSRLVQRRFKRLSLNRILVSKPEIKHTNDKVFVTVYLFNKKKNSLLYKLKHLYEDITYKKGILPSLKKSTFSNFSSKRNLGSKTSKLKTKGLAFKKGSFYVINKKNYILSGRTAAILYRRHKRVIGKSNSLFRLLKKSSKFNIRASLYKHYASRYIIKRRGRKYNNKNIGRNLYNNFYNKFKNRNRGGFKKSTFSTLIRNNAFNYKKTSHLTKVKMMRFISSLNIKTNNSIINSKVLSTIYNNKPRNLDSNVLVRNKKLTFGALAIPSFSRSSVILKNYYSALNKYKLYKDTSKTMPYISNLGVKMQDNSSNLNTNTLAISKPLLYISNIYKYLKVRQRFMLGLHNPFISDRINNISTDLLPLKKGNLNISMQKVNALYKLFTLYSNIDFYQYNALLTNNITLNRDNIGNVPYDKKVNSLSLYSNKITLSTYKLLKKSFACITSSLINNNNSKVNKKVRGLCPSGKNIVSNISNDIKIQRLVSKPITKFLFLYNKKRLSNHKARLFWLRRVKGKRISRRYIKRTIRNLILLQKMNKINRFFKRYKDLLHKKNTTLQNINGNNTIDINSALHSSENNIATMYKLNYIREILNKDLLYIYYIKMLSLNTNVFKNWFLNSLKNILSKIYNKKVILNLVSLKYIHLNSDIFTQAITVRLRNFKKNRLNKVLRKALKLIVLSKLNNYSYDIHSPVNKFIENYYRKFKSLNMDIFNDLGLDLTSNIHTSKDMNGTTSYLNPSYSPKLIKGLTSVQSSTINFIRHKSVFGVRLEAAGRLTKRSTASRAIFKIRYKGSLRNNAIINRSNTSTMIKNQRISNLQFTKISSKTRNGSFGLKGWLNNN